MSPWWRVLQLTDSAFPTGAFAHSGGLEAALHFDVLRFRDLHDLACDFLWTTGRSALPFVEATHRRPDELWSIDWRLDAQLTNHVTNRASRAQGRSFLGACSRIHDDATLSAWSDRARLGAEVPAHLPAIFGACLQVLGVPELDTTRGYLFISLRGLLSAAIRLGVIGPYEGQRLIARCGPLLENIAGQCTGLPLDEAATTAPLLDIMATNHDRLYARLFQS